MYFSIYIHVVWKLSDIFRIYVIARFSAIVYFNVITLHVQFM